MASREERRQRITDLYTVGEVLQIAPGEMVFVKKLNQFEDGEARADAMAARSRLSMVQRDDTNPETRTLRQAVQNMDKARLIEGIVSGRYTKYMADAATSVQADPEWGERLNVLDRTDYDSAKPEERTLLDDLNAAYLNDITEKARENEQADREGLDREDTEEVQKLYEEAVIEARAAAAYIGEYKYGQIAWAVRMCDAEDPGDGEWDHSKCKHERLYVDQKIEEEDGTERVKRAVEFVKELPDVLLDEYVRVLDRVQVGALRAKGSASRQSSSEPSRQQSEEEASAPSTQEATSSEPVGTSA